MQQPAKVAVILIVLCSSLGCDALVRATRDQAYADARRMPGLDDTSLTLAPQVANPLALRRLVVRHQYAILDSLLTAAAESAHADVRTESFLFTAYDAMAGDTALAGPLQQWSRERPTSAPAYLARASYLLNMGWAARGTAYARSTPREAMDRMHELFRQAKGCIDTALTLTPRSAEAYLLLLGIAKPSMDSAPSHEYVMNGLEDIPASFVLRRQYLRNLIPRWGGSYGAMRLFVDESKPMADSNPRLRALEGYIYLDYAEVYEIRRQRDKAFENYDYVLTLGDEPRFHLERGEALLRAGRASDALPDLDSAVAGAPGLAEAYLWRGMAREQAGQKQGALLDYQQAVVLDGTSTTAASLFEHLYRIAH